MSVNMFDEQVDLSTLDSEAAAEVLSFATDVSSSLAASVSSSLGVSAESIEATCLYRNSDVTKLDLLTLEGSCESSRILQVANFLEQRRLQVEGFCVEIEVFGDDAVRAATESDAEDSGKSATDMLAARIASTEVVIKSDLLPIGVTVDAGMSSISVAVATHAPTGDPTAHTPRPPESATARSPTSTPKLPANGAKSSNSDGQDANEEKLTEDMTEPDAGKETARETISSGTHPSSKTLTSTLRDMIAGGALVASFAVLVRGFVFLWSSLKKAFRPIDFDNIGEVTKKEKSNVVPVHVRISEVGPDGVEVTKSRTLAIDLSNVELVR
jgi:hypothetical protein